VNVIAGDVGINSDGVGEHVTGTVVCDAITVIVHHRGRNKTQVARLALNSILSRLVDFRLEQESGNDALADRRLG